MSDLVHSTKHPHYSLGRPLYPEIKHRITPARINARPINRVKLSNSENPKIGSLPK
jgi:hypothetical protein